MSLEEVDLPLMDPPSLPQGLAARLRVTAAECEAKEPVSMASQTIDANATQSYSAAEVFVDSGGSTSLPRFCAEDLCVAAAAVRKKEVTEAEIAEVAEVRRLRNELAAAEMRSLEMEGRQDELLAELKAFQLEIRQEEAYNQELKAEAQPGAGEKHAARELTAAGAKLFRLLQAQYVMGRPGEALAGQRPLYSLPKSSAFDEAAKTLLSEMSASLQALQEAPCLRGQGQHRTSTGAYVTKLSPDRSLLRSSPSDSRNCRKS